MTYYYRSPSLSSPWIMHYIEFNRWEAYQVRKSYYVHVGAFVSMHRCVCLCEKLQRLLHILQLMNVKITKQSATQWNKKTVWANGREKKLHCSIYLATLKKIIIYAKQSITDGNVLGNSSAHIHSIETKRHSMNQHSQSLKSAIFQRTNRFTF